MSPSTIISEAYAVDMSNRLGWIHARPGVVLTMSDGAQWFHPYDGGKPIQRRCARDQVLD